MIRIHMQKFTKVSFYFPPPSRLVSLILTFVLAIHPTPLFCCVLLNRMLCMLMTPSVGSGILCVLFYLFYVINMECSIPDRRYYCIFFVKFEDIDLLSMNTLQGGNISELYQVKGSVSSTLGQFIHSSLFVCFF